MNTANLVPEAPQASPLAGLLSIKDIPERYATVFPTVESARWYLRQHRAELDSAGALLVIRGQLRLVPDRFEAQVLRAGQAAARRISQHASAGSRASGAAK